MSAGHGHSRDNLHSHRELEKLLGSGGAPELMARWQHVDVDHDMPDLAGYDVAGTTRYLDRDFLHALLDPEYAKQIIGEPIDTGLSPEDTLDAIVGLKPEPGPGHECIEKVILDADNPIDGYLEAHELATCGEHEIVRKKLGSNRGWPFGKGHLWPLGTASFAKPLSPKRCGLPGARLNVSTIKDALGSVHGDVDHCPGPMQFQQPAAVDGP
jgi:hypothetical protein